MQKIIECVPNFSEGRKTSVIKKISQAAKKVKGVKVLDTEWNASHNRSLVTIVGTPKDVYKAAFLMVKQATKLINMEKHIGEHPRIGATDVVPFIPVSGVRMEECVSLSKKFGAQVAKELKIPVYLYEEAASRPERKNLATIREGQYEGLKKEILTNPNKKPDFGPSRFHKTAGAIVIGARKYLIAFNVNLNTADVTIAKEIASKIREKNGGLLGIKALGFLVDGFAQISINVTDFEKTNIDTVYFAILKEAEKFGVTIKNSEIYGMIPLDSLVSMAKSSLQTTGFSRNQILEEKLHE